MHSSDVHSCLKSSHGSLALQKNREKMLSQDSNDLYRPAVIDAAVSWELAEMDSHHGPPSELTRQWAHSQLVQSSTFADLLRVSNKGWNGLKLSSELQRSASQVKGTSAKRAAEALHITR